jgi:hypothetical protein
LCLLHIPGGRFSPKLCGKYESALSASERLLLAVSSL